MKTRILLLLMAALMAYGCRSTRTAKSEETKEDFNTFYAHFLSDSTFQMSRITFPLPGINPTATEGEEDSVYYWQKEDWIMLTKPELDTTLYERKLTVTDTLATDEIFMDDAGFYFKTMYKPVEKKWYLVYMVDSNM